MRVGIVAYLLHRGADYRSAGVSVYIDRLLQALPTAAPQHKYVAFTGPTAPGLEEVQSVCAPVSVSRPPVRIAWEQLGLPFQAARTRMDLVHGTVNVVPEIGRTPTVVTVHDLSFMRYPERLSSARRTYLKLAVARSARRANRVIAVSRSTLRDLVELAGVTEERISVVYQGVDPGFRPLTGDRDAISKRHFNGRPYILHVGTLEPRKNLDVLVRAYAEVRRRLGIPHVLALVGARGWMYQPLFDLVGTLSLQNHVRFVDYVPPADLPLWYNGADLFAYPSAYEGFGLPVLEAMACGTPTITSSSSSLGELAGTACLAVEPGSEEALEMALTRALEDVQLREEMRQTGLVRASEFSWTRTARETAAVYQAAREGA